MTPDGEKIELNEYYKEVNGEIVKISKEEFSSVLDAGKNNVHSKSQKLNADSVLISCSDSAVCAGKSWSKMYANLSRFITKTPLTFLHWYATPTDDIS